MPIERLPDMLDAAIRGGYGVGYFESWDLASLDAVLDAAEAERSPVVIGFGGMMVDAAWMELRGVRILGWAARMAARKASVPVAVMFNEAQTLAQADEALDSGVNALLLSTDDLSKDEAVRVTADITDRAHGAGIAVEAELGHLPDAGAGSDEGGELTDPAEAAEFVKATKIDCLAVSIGNVHVKTDGWATIDRGRLEDLRASVGIPFAVHGGTSFPPDAVPHAVANGVAKFNVGTILKKVYWQALQESVRSSASTNVHDLLGSHKPDDITAAARAALTEKVRELMRVYGSSGRAEVRP